MGAAVSIRIPSWQVNERRPALQRFANPENRSELMRRLLEMDFTNLTATGDVNPHIKESTVSVIGSRGIDSEAEFDSAIANTDAPIPARQGLNSLLVLARA